MLGSFEANGTAGLTATTETNAGFGFSSPFGAYLGTTVVGADPTLPSTLVLEYDLAGGASALAATGRAGLLFWGTISGTTELVVTVEVLLSGTLLRPARRAFLNVVNGAVAGVLDNIDTSGGGTLRITLTLPEGEARSPTSSSRPDPTR